MTRKEAFRSVWAVIGSSTKSKPNMVVINMYQVDDENKLNHELRCNGLQRHTMEL